MNFIFLLYNYLSFSLGQSVFTLISHSSEALPITTSDILDTPCHISSEEYTIVKNNYDSITLHFERYLLRAIKLNNKGILEKQALYKYSTRTEILKKSLSNDRPLRMFFI